MRGFGNIVSIYAGLYRSKFVLGHFRNTKIHIARIPVFGRFRISDLDQNLFWGDNFSLSSFINDLKTPK